MTEPSPQEPSDQDDPAPEEAAAEDRFAGLAERPVAEHVEVFEDEHARLQRRLGTIDSI